MPAADSYIEENDANAVKQKIKTRDDGTGIHSPYGAMIVNDAAVSTGNPVPTAPQSVIPGTGATNLGKAVDSAAGGTDTGVAPLAVRDDALTTLTPVDGDYTPLRVTSTGALWVSADSPGHEYQEDAGASSGDYGSLILGVRNEDAAALTSADGDYGGIALDQSGRVLITQRPPVILTWTPTLDTGAYASGDSLYTTVTTLANAHHRNGGVVRVRSLTVLDKSSPSGANNPAPIDVLFFSASITPTAANSPSAISDADMANCIGFATIGAFTTNTINAFGQRLGADLIMKLGASTTSLYVACIVRGTPTYGASDLVFTMVLDPDA